MDKLSRTKELIEPSIPLVFNSKYLFSCMHPIAVWREHQRAVLEGRDRDRLTAIRQVIEEDPESYKRALFRLWVESREQKAEHCYSRIYDLDRIRSWLHQEV